jgi:hypothetical protein
MDAPARAQFRKNKKWRQPVDDPPSILEFLRQKATGSANTGHIAPVVELSAAHLGSEFPWACGPPMGMKVHF